MLAKSRYDKICQIINSNGAVTTARLVKEFGVSVETIRRDLLFLENKGMLTRVHGGAVGIADMKVYSALEERNMEFVEQKAVLCDNALAFIDEGDVIAIDTGSTAICLAKAIRERFSKLTVVTHSLDVLKILEENKGIELILCGGHYHSAERTFCGSMVIDALEKIHVQKAFIFPVAVSLEFGICEYRDNFGMIQRQMAKCADKVFILADSSKFEKKSLLKMSDMKSEYCYITDNEISDDLIKLYEENNINIVKGREI